MAQENSQRKRCNQSRACSAAQSNTRQFPVQTPFAFNYMNLEDANETKLNEANRRNYARSRLWLYFPLRRCRVWLNSGAAPSRPFACVKYKPTSFERSSSFSFRPNKLVTRRATTVRIFMLADTAK